MQLVFAFGDGARLPVAPLKPQLLKWVGSKQRFAHQIASFFPERFGRYFEPFLGSGAVLATLAPRQGVGSDAFRPLMEIWQTLRDDPLKLKSWYAERWHAAARSGKATVYDEVRRSYNARPNGADLVFLCRACYGGVVRFRRSDGFMSTPCGAHAPITPATFSARVDLWHERTAGTEFLNVDFETAMSQVRRGDLVYCDPPYQDSQRILYGAQAFDLDRLFEAIAQCKARGAFVALSIDGTKRSGEEPCEIGLPAGLFLRQVLVNCGRSMLRRFQMSGRTLEREVVADRLLLTY